MTDSEKVLQCFRTPMVHLEGFLYLQEYFDIKNVKFRTFLKEFIDEEDMCDRQFIYIEYWQLSRPNDPMAVKPTVDTK